MRRRSVIITIVCVIIACPLLLLAILLWRIKSGTPLVVNGKVIAVAKESSYSPWNDRELDVSSGSNNLFSVWEDFSDAPLFIYPFADGKRFLCIYDDDTCVPVFVIDLNPSATNFVQSPLWPSDDYLRTFIASRMTNVVINTKGVVRLPTYPELQETSSYLGAPGPGQPKDDHVRAYNSPWSLWSKRNLLSALATNRNKGWP